MQLPFLGSNFSYQVDCLFDDDFMPGNIPGLSSYATYPEDIYDIQDGEFNPYPISLPFQGGVSSFSQSGFFSEDFWDRLQDYLGGIQEWVAGVTSRFSSAPEWGGFNLGHEVFPSGGGGKYTPASFPDPSITALYAYTEDPPPESSTPSSSIPLVSAPETSLPASSVPVDSSPFDTRPQVGPLTPEEGRAMAVKVARQLMIDFPGMTKEQAAGIVGNLWHESAGMNANVNEFGSGPPDQNYGPPNGSQFGYGWAQWTGSRKWDYINFCKREGLDPSSPAANYAFLKHELKNGEADGTPSSLPHILAVNTVDGAAYAFRQKYERATMPVDSERLKHARELYGLL